MLPRKTRHDQQVAGCPKPARLLYASEGVTSWCRVGASIERLAGEKAYEFCLGTSTAGHLQIGPKALNDRAGHLASQSQAKQLALRTWGQLDRCARVAACGSTMRILLTHY